MIIFEGIFKRNPVDLTNGYNQFMFNRYLAMTDGGKYARQIVEVDKLGELTDEEHFALMLDIVPKGFHTKWERVHIFTKLNEYNAIAKLAKVLKEDIRTYFTYWYSLSKPAQTREKKKIEDYAKNAIFY